MATGAFWDDIAAFGGPRRTPGESIKVLAESVHLGRGQRTSGDAVHFHGKYRRPDGATNHLIDEAAEKATRPASAIRRLYNIAGELKETERFPSGAAGVVGPAARGVDPLSEGMSAYFLYLVESADVIRRLAEEVVPEVSEIVAKERGRPSKSIGSTCGWYSRARGDRHLLHTP